MSTSILTALCGPVNRWLLRHGIKEPMPTA
jgi:hypothetical protein